MQSEKKKKKEKKKRKKFFKKVKKTLQRHIYPLDTGYFISMQNEGCRMTTEQWL